MSLFRAPQRKPPSQQLLSRTEFEGHFRLVTFENDDGTYKVVTFCVGEEEFKAAGNFFGAGAGEPLTIKGEWKEHPKYGWTFMVDSYLVQTPTTLEGIQAYLGSGLIKGVGPRTAQRIVEHFGDKTLETLDDAPELLSEAPGVSRKLARSISQQWSEHTANREAMIFLKEQGLTTAMALRLIRHYGDNVVGVLRENPYRAGLEVPLVGFAKADAIAERLGIAKDSPQRLQAALVHVLDESGSEGHTHLLRGELLERATGKLGAVPASVEEALEQVLELKLLRQEDLGGDEEPAVFTPVLHSCESGCAELLLNQIQQAKPLLPGPVDEDLRAFEQRFRFQLAPQQADAIRSVATGGVCVITGGPGTGKTTLVRALLHVVKQQKGIKFALCSPTGRAAQRLTETTGEEAATIHRLLKFNAKTGQFTYHAKNKLPLDLLIIDEASMLDVVLAFALLRALPDQATVVFVGDVDQLPSVGPGTFLRDLISSGRPKTTRLEVIFRQASASLIITNSHRINEGHTIKPGERGDKDDFFFIERDEAESLQETLVTMVLDRIPKKLGSEARDDIQVLTPMRRGPLGTAELNRLLQDAINPSGQVLHAQLGFRSGDKVIQTSNNYDLDVYNGDVGRLADFDMETQTVRVNFGRRAVYYPFENLHELELAYAITIHKSQGSEYKAAVVVMHTSHFIMLRRNLLYTAVTRGKRLVVLIGSKRAVHTAIRTSSEKERRTALERWLTRPPGLGDELALR